MYTIIAFLWQYIRNPKAIIAFSILVALISLYRVIPFPFFVSLMIAYCIALIIYAVYWWIRRRKHIQHGEALAEAIEQDSSVEYQEQSVTRGKNENKSQLKSRDSEALKQIQQQIKTSVQLIRKSKLGDKKGRAALYELPWYMVIGNPAAGKSSAIYNSGLKFPFEENHQQMISAGLSGTRNCDWFFSTEGVLLDTAGRYSVYSDDHSEWLGFLKILKKHRPKTPINGVLIVVNTAELISQSPDQSIQLAKNLRARIQDLTERLEIHAPVYVVFSKMDLIAGFSSFFECFERDELDQIWGATLAFEENSSSHAGELFSYHFDLLVDGLKNVSTTYLSRRHAKNISPSVMTFPLEFKNLKNVLQVFIQTLFEDNPYQFKPIFRGFYLSSALQQGVIESPMTQYIAQAFDLSTETADKLQHDLGQQHSYFLKSLFSKVILKDKHLVKQHINSKNKQQRYLGFILVLTLSAVILGLWLWSYRNNQQLIAEVNHDLQRVSQIQQATPDLATQLDAILIIQQRLQILDDFDLKRPIKFSLGLYQGDRLRQKLRAEYLNAIRQIILEPAQQNMANYLSQVKQNEERLKANYATPQAQKNQVGANSQVASTTQTFAQPSVSHPQDAYNALKAYLMLSNRDYLESAHLTDQVTRFWRPWLLAHMGQKPDINQKAEQILAYMGSLIDDPQFPQLNSDPQLVDQTRQVLVSVIQGMSARDRVYNEIKMRAAVRYPALTVVQIIGDKNRQLMSGSYALPGMFTQKAWDEYIQQAIETAANQPTETRDWVLNTKQSDDLSFSASPEQIRKQLTLAYKQEYSAEWKKFIHAVRYTPADQFNQNMKNIELLSDSEQSPIRLFVERVVQETSWDNPAVQAELAANQPGFMAWFKRTILRQGQSGQTDRAVVQVKGELAQDFIPFFQMLRNRDDLQNKSLLQIYLENFTQIRSKMSELVNAGDVGPGALLLLQQTMNEKNTVFNQEQKYIDEKMMLGLNPQDRLIIQKLFTLPMMQSFQALYPPAQQELNKLWNLQVYQPYQQNLSQKYPFNPNASLQASSQEIAQVFGETGSISQFVKNNLDPLIIRRGNSINAKTWKGLGIGLDPQFIADFPNYIAPLQGGAGGELAQTAGQGATRQSNFQFYPLAQPQLLSYSIEIDGQRLNYENGLQQWVSFIWPNPGAIPGVRVTAVDLEGHSHTIVDEPGEYGINRFIDSAQRNKKADSIQMTWVSKTNPSLFVRANFRLISGSEGGSRGYNGLKLVEKIVSQSNVATVIAAQSSSTAQAKPALQP